MIFIVFLRKYSAFIRTQTSEAYTLSPCIYCETKKLTKKIFVLCKKNLFIYVKNPRFFYSIRKKLFE